MLYNVIHSLYIYIIWLSKRACFVLHASEVDQAPELFAARPLSSIRNHRKTPFPWWTMESQLVGG